MKLSKWLLFLFVFSLQLNMVFSEEEKADEEKSDKTEKGDKKKSVEFKLEGLITKNRKDAIILKTNMEEIILPPVPAGDTKMRYEDFLNKNVVLIGMGYTVPDKKNPNFPDRHKLKSVKEITLKE